MTYIPKQPWFTSLMSEGDVIGECANCQKVVREHLFTLDDCYGVYRGRCPHCNAVNLLDRRKSMRGYTSREMFLVLPTDHEVKKNKWEADIPVRQCTCGTCKEEGKDDHGT